MSTISKYDKKPVLGIDISWLQISKFFFFVFFLYENWYMQIWGDRAVILYGSVIALTVSLLIPFIIGEQKFDFNCMTPFLIVLLIFGVYCLLSGLLVAIAQTDFISSMITYFCFIVVLYDCCLISEREGNWEWFLKIVVAVAFVCGIQTVFFGQGMRNGSATVITMGPNNNPNSLSPVMLFGIFGLVGNRKHATKNFEIKLLLILLFFYTIVLTGSRKGLISAAIFLIIWFYSIILNIKTNIKGFRKYATITLMLIAAVIVVLYFIRYYVNSEQFTRLNQLLGSEGDSANEDRVRMYEVAVDLWEKNPIFGVGFNQFKYYSWRGDYSHSTYAELLSCTGIIGSLIIFVPVIMYFISILRNAWNASIERRYIYLICFAALSIELFLGVGQIWVYGIVHEAFLLCIFGIFDSAVKNDMIQIAQNEDRKKCRYLK